MQLNIYPAFKYPWIIHTLKCVCTQEVSCVRALLFSLTLREDLLLNTIRVKNRRWKRKPKNTHKHTAQLNVPKTNLFFNLLFFLFILLMLDCLPLSLSPSLYVRRICFTGRAKYQDYHKFFFLKEVYYKWSKCHGFWYICVSTRPTPSSTPTLPSNFQNTRKINGWSHLILEKSHIQTHTAAPHRTANWNIHRFWITLYT